MIAAAPSPPSPRRSRPAAYRHFRLASRAPLRPFSSSECVGGDVMTVATHLPARAGRCLPAEHRPANDVAPGDEPEAAA